MNLNSLKIEARMAESARKPGIYIVVLVYLIISAVLELISSRIGTIIINWSSRTLDYISYSPTYIPVFSSREWIALLFVWVLGLMSQIIAVGFMSYCLLVIRGRAAEVSELGRGFSLSGKIFLLMLLEYIFIALWSMLFVIPGIIASYRYRQAYYILLDDPSKGAMQCIRESKAMMYGHKGELFMLDLSFLGWYILIYLTFGIVGIWKLGYIKLTYAIFYNALAYPDGGYPLNGEAFTQE